MPVCADRVRGRGARPWLHRRNVTTRDAALAHRGGLRAEAVESRRIRLGDDPTPL